MSDFITNLLVRSMGSAPVVKPRLPSLFEPSTPYAVSLAESYPSEERAVIQTRPQNIRDRSRDHGAKIERTDSPTERPVAIGKSQPFHELDPRPDALPAPPFSEILREEDVPAPTQTPASPPSVEPLRNNHQPLRQAASKGLSSLLHRPIAQPQRMISEIPQLVERDLDEAAPRPFRKLSQPAEWQVNPLSRETESREAEHPPTFAHKATEATESLKIPRLDFARHIPPAPSVTPPEPTIQVTIGRIEVRAVSTPSTAPKQRATSPVMTLQDYLRTKRGGA